MKLFHLAVSLLVAAAIAQPVAACVSDPECDDLDVCNGIETCQGGVCVPGGALVCNDDDPCTTNECDPMLGCIYPASAGCMAAGRKMKLGARSPETRRITIQTEGETGIAGSAFPVNFGPGDPVQHGATMRVFSDDGDTFDGTYAMPKDKWEYIKAPGENGGYKYKDKANEHGPIKIALIRNGKPSKIKGGGLQLQFTLSSDPDPVKVVLQFGTEQICLQYGGISKFNTGKAYKAKKAPAPSVCPFP